MSKATSPATWLNPFRVWPLVTDTAASLRVDESDHIWHLAALAWAVRGDMITTTVPVGGFEDVDAPGTCCCGITTARRSSSTRWRTTVRSRPNWSPPDRDARP